MGWVKAALALVSNLLAYLKGRQDIANDPVIKQNKEAQGQQDLTDRIDQLVNTAMMDPDPRKRAAALEELRKMDSE